mgnify:CR=1 FL=1
MLTDIQVVLAEGDLVPSPGGLEDHGEVVVRVLVDLRPLVLVLDVLDRQRVELENVLQQLEVIFGGGLDVEPEPRVSGGGKTPFYVDDLRLGHLALGRDQSSHAAHAKEYAHRLCVFSSHV